MRRAGFLVALLLLLAVAATLAGAAWLFTTEGGLRWALAHAGALADGKLALEDARGTLASEVSIARLRYGGDGIEVEAHDVRGRGSALALLRGKLGIEPLRIARLRVELPEAKAPSKPAPDLAPPFGIRLGDVHVERLELRTAEGRELITDLRLAHLALDARALSLAGSAERPDQQFPARVAFKASGSLEKLVATLDARIAEVPLRAELELARRDGRYAGLATIVNASPGPLDAGALPVRVMRVRFAGTELPELRVELAGGAVLAGRGRLEDMRLLADLRVRDLDLRALRSNLRRTALAGDVKVAIGRDAQSASGALAQEGLRIEGQLERAGDTIELRALRAATAGGELRGDARLRLGEPLRAQARLQLERVDPSALGDFPQGAITGELDAEGDLGAEPRLDARWQIRGSTLLGEPLQSEGRGRFSRERAGDVQAQARLGPVRATARGSLGRPGDKLAWTMRVDDLTSLDARVSGRLEASGTLTGTLTDPAVDALARAWDLRLPGDATERAVTLRLEGRRRRHEAQIAVKGGDVQAKALLAGSLSDALAWEGEIRSLANEGLYPLRLLAPAPLRVSRGGVSLGRFEAALDEGRVDMRELAWSDGRLVTSGVASALPAQWLVLAAGMGETVRSTMRVDGQWSLAATPALEGALTLRHAGGDVDLIVEGEAYPAGLSAAALEARIAAGRVELRLDADSRYGKLAVEGGVGAALDAQSPVNVRARFDAAALGALTQPFVTQARVEGRLWADLRVTGTLGEPHYSGALRGEQLRAEVPPYGVFLKDGAFAAELEGDRLHLQSFSIRGGEGEFTAKGSVPLRFAEGGAKLEWSARALEVLARADLRLTVSGDGQAGFDGRRLSLTGALRADRGYLRIARDALPQLGEDVVIEGRPAPEPATRAALPVSLDVELDLGRDLSIETRALEGRLTGRLRLTGREGEELAAFGRLQLVNATYFAYGYRLQIDPGVLIFDGAIRNPGLQVTAWRRNQAVEVGVQVSGNVQAPRVVLVSTPAVSEAEALSWLVLGRAPGEANRADLGLLQVAAGELLSSGSALPLDRRLARAVGLDEVTLRGGGGVEQNVVAFGKRLSDRLYVTYEQGLGAVASNLVKLDYSLGRRWSLRAETGTTTSGAGLFYRFSWD
ncbi:MAG: translocation/assembly module TamB domain-containing protein [Vicinamibacteria bacterium]